MSINPASSTAKSSSTKDQKMQRESGVHQCAGLIACTVLVFMMASALPTPTAHATTGSWTRHGEMLWSSYSKDYAHQCFLNTYRDPDRFYLPGDNELWFGCYSVNNGGNDSFVRTQASTDDTTTWDESRAAKHSAGWNRNDGSPHIANGIIRSAGIQTCENVPFWYDACDPLVKTVSGPFL
jgi:hypothetical protein